MNQIRSIFSTIKISSLSLFLCQVFLLVTSTACDSAQRKYLEIHTRATDDAISKSQSLQELNKICTDVRLPAGFIFVHKGGMDDQKVTLAYYYYSEISFNEARRTFEKYFIEKGWSEEDLSHRYPKELRFKDNEYLIAINYSSGGTSNYSVYCEKLKN